MRRLLRIILNLLTILSLLLSLACAALWVRGYWRGDWFRWVRPPRLGAETWFVSFMSGGGGMAIHLGFYSPQTAQERGKDGATWRIDNRPPIPYAGGGTTNRFGFGYEYFFHSLIRYHGVLFPTWLPTIGFALLPATRLALSIRRRQRKLEGHCPTCGYDLRATPERCPECGLAAV